ncbi:MAG: hypothetical protein K6F61_02635 [Clostridiales bacterium]|nr:hypothetical protein [Clostridiales bacterium]
MAQGIQPGEKPDARNVYADIIDLPHWEPGKKHPRMSLHDRAAQFVPFAALVGYDEMVDEEARLTDRQIEPGEEQLNLLNQQLNVINDAITGGNRPEVAITFFIPDEHKAGGRYATITAKVKRIDTTARQVFLVTRDQPDIPETILFDRIISLQGGLVDSLDDSY